MIMSLDVKTVNKEMMKYNPKNNVYWFLENLFANLFAIYLKKPKTSKKIDKNVIDKNNTSILIGLIDVWAVKPFHTVSKETDWIARRIAAPKRAITQKVAILKFFILILGKNIVEKIIPKTVITAIINDAICINYKLLTISKNVS